MSKIIKLLSILISVIMVISVCFTGCSKETESVDSASSSMSDISSKNNSSENNSSENESEYGTSSDFSSTVTGDNQNVNIEYLPLSAGQAQKNTVCVGGIKGRTNDVLLYDNPDRGFRSTIPLVIHPAHPDPDDPTKTTNTCDLILRDKNGRVSYNKNSKCTHDVRHVFGNLDYETKKRAIDYSFQLVYLNTGKTDYNATLILMQGSFIGCNKSSKLPDYIFEALDIYFNNCRERGIRILFRYGYHGVQLNWQVSEANRQEHLKYGASEATMISHIKQLAPYIGKNLDVIHKMSSGFIGSGGEMAYAYQYPVVSYTNVIRAVIENICVPYNLYYTVRLARYKVEMLEEYKKTTGKDYPYADIIGFNNDAFFGEQTKDGWNSGCHQYNHPNCGGYCWKNENGYFDEWQYINENAAYTPQSGEMFHNLQNSNKFISGFEAILELAHHRYTTISQWNSYIEAGYTTDSWGNRVAADTVMQRWINDEKITQKWLKDNKIVYDPAWFYDERGNEVTRSTFEFVRDHLGYRIQAQAFTKTGNKVKLTLKNYGFAAAFALESGFAVLDENYKVVKSVKAGNPDTWYSHDPENYKSDKVLEHTVEAEISVPNDGKTYYIAFYLKNDMNRFARFANDPESIPFKGAGYNILCKIN